MAATEVISIALERNWSMVDNAIASIDDAALTQQPNDQSNSAAWLLWHMNRVVDNMIHTRLQSLEQLWVREGWHQKFGMSDDQIDFGMGWTAEQVAAWQAPSREVLVGYYEALKASAREYLSSLSDEGLSRSVVVPPNNESRAVSDILGVMVYDNVVHGGQIAYLRGYYGGMGWHR
ncbi:MAG: DinB family protein [Dehalococcoidia bacterium]